MNKLVKQKFSRTLSGLVLTCTCICFHAPVFAADEQKRPRVITNTLISPIKLYDRDWNEVASIKERTFRKYFVEHVVNEKTIEGVLILEVDMSLGLYKVRLENKKGDIHEGWVPKTAVEVWPPASICDIYVRGEPDAPVAALTYGLGGCPK